MTRKARVIGAIVAVAGGIVYLAFMEIISKPLVITPS